MSSKLFVGGLPFSTSGSDLEILFGAHGQVLSAVVINDRETGRSRGFGFVEMSDPDGAQRAIEELDGRNVDGRNIIVNEARERAPRPRAVNSGW